MNEENLEDSNEGLSDTSFEKRQSLMYRSQIGNIDKTTSFNLQQILKKRFKNFSRVKKFKEFENKIVNTIDIVLHKNSF